MSRITLRSRVDTDGVLRLEVPFGAAEADQPMQITIESLQEEPLDSLEYTNWLDGISGQWQGEFERIPVSDFEQRDSL